MMLRMKIRVSFEGIRATGDISDRVVSVFSSLERQLVDFGDDLTIADVRIARRARWGYKVIFNMPLPGKPIHVERRGGDLMNVVRRVRDIARRQVRKHVEHLQEYS